MSEALSLDFERALHARAKYEKPDPSTHIEMGAVKCRFNHLNANNAEKIHCLQAGSANKRPVHIGNRHQFACVGGFN
jgi:hypothetical protein